MKFRSIRATGIPRRRRSQWTYPSPCSEPAIHRYPVLRSASCQLGGRPLASRPLLEPTPDPSPSG